MELIAVTNDRLDVDTLTRIMIEVEPFIDYFIIRERRKSAAEYMRLINKLAEANVNKAKLIVNDRVDAAVIAGINKVQLPGHGFTVGQVKSNYPHIRAGRSIHSLDEAIEANESGADWLLYGHIYDTDCKKGTPARGLDELKAIAEKVPSDIYAIGGIKPCDVKEISEVKVKGIAVMSSIFDNDNPALAAEEYYEACQSLSRINGGKTPTSKL